MDDMKKLIEKYKQELMAYRKSSDSAVQNTFPADSPLSGESKPQIIGYADKGDVNELYESLFEQRPDETRADFPEDNPPETNAQATDNSHELPQTAQDAAAAEEDDAQNAPNETIFDFEEFIESPEEMFSPPRYNEIPSFGEVQSEITQQSRAEDNPPPPEPVSTVADNSPTQPLPEPAAAQRVSPETAQRLTEQPVSGTNPSEQLTGRSFESDERPANDPADIKPNGNGAPAVKYEDRSYESYAEFERDNPRTGSLRFRTFTARGALPVSGAVCVVTKTFGNKTEVLSTQTTDISGQTEIIPLPAPPRSLSLSPNSTTLPYALYNAEIRAQGFEDIFLKNIPIFEGILSVQNCALIPSPPDAPDESEIIDEAVLSGGE